MTKTPDHFGEFEQRKKLVVKFAERLSVLATAGHDEEAARVLGDFMGRFSNNRFLLLVVGDFKSGKSTLVNALVGKAVCPVKATPRTAKVTRLSATAGPRDPETVEISFHRDRPTERRLLNEGPLDELVAVNGRRTSEVELVDVYLNPGPTILRNPIRLVDTPGIGSGEAEHSKVAREYLRHADAVLFVFSGSKPYSETERDFLLTFRSLIDRIVFAANRIDDVPVEDRADVLDHIRSSLVRDVLESGTSAPVIYPVSATKALAAIKTASAEQLDASGLPGLVEALEERLAGGLALSLLGKIAEQQAQVCNGLTDRGQLAVDALMVAVESIQTKRPRLAELGNDIQVLSRESTKVQENARENEKRVLGWSPGRIAQFRGDVVTASSNWVKQCSSEDICKKQLPGIVAKLIADHLDSIDREVALHLVAAQDIAETELRKVFEAMESRARKVLAPGRAGPARGAGGMGRGASALSQLAALAEGLGGPTQGYGLASSALASAFAPSSTVQFLSVAAAVSLVIATLGGPVGWLVAGVASFIATLAGYNHATTWRERVLKHVAEGLDKKVIPRAEEAVEETVRTFFYGLIVDVEQRSSAFLAHLTSVVAEVEREVDRESLSREREAERLHGHLQRLELLRGDLLKFGAELPINSSSPKSTQIPLARKDASA
jgi:GTP-binding protein EngB required for normal cell division